MNRFLDRLAYAAVILAFVYASVSWLQFPADGETRRPAVRFAAPVPGVSAPAAPPDAPAVIVEVPETQPSTGTAFAVGEGWWLTARHVADGCDAVGLATAPGRAVQARQVVLHPGADLALLSLGLDTAPLRFAAEPWRRGEDGYAVGYPQGAPGDVHATLIGPARLRSVGRYRTDEPILAWAERRRVPDRLPALGGLSGGPLFNARGEVVGVLVAASQRRGRVMTTDPGTASWLLEQAGVDSGRGTPAADFAAANFVRRGDSLRGGRRVAKVVCHVERPRRRRPW